MDMLQTTFGMASCPNLSVPNEELVALRLDQLEDLGKYSVIYEIARIETILSHAFNRDPMFWAQTAV
jgi:hypothetical protein